MKPILKTVHLLHIITLILLNVSLANSQNFINSLVLDSKSKMPLEFVLIHNRANDEIVETNSKGEFILPINSLSDTLEITYLGYYNLRLISGDVKAEILLLQNINYLQEVKIYSNKNSIPLNSKNLYPISIVSKDSFLYVLNRQNKIKEDKYVLQIYNESGVIEEVVKIEESKNIELVKNCHGNIYLKVGNEYVLIEFVNNLFRMVEKISENDYTKLYRNCIGYFKSTYMYELEKLNGLNKLYFVVNTDSFTLVKSILFEEKIENYKEDMGFIEYGKNVSTMEIYDAGLNSKIRRAQASSFLLENIIHKNRVNNFAFDSDSNFVLFNFDEGKIEWIDIKGQISKTIDSVEFLSSSHFENLIVQDKAKQKYYAIKKMSSGFKIYDIDIFTGTISEYISLDVAFLDALEILNGNIFALGRKNNTEFNKLYFK